MKILVDVHIPLMTVETLHRLVELRDRVHQRGPDSLDLLDGPLQGGRHLLGVLDGAFGIPAQ
jgi:hypothetical protein